MVGVLEILALIGQPGGQLIPLPQQAFQRHLDHDVAIAGVRDEQPPGDESLEQRPTLGRQIIPACDAPHRPVAVGVDRGEPRNECAAEPAQLCGTSLAIRSEQGVDLGLHDASHPAHRVVIRQRQRAVAGVVLVEPGQRQGEQRQCVRTLGAVLQEVIDQCGLDRE